REDKGNDHRGAQYYSIVAKYSLQASICFLIAYACFVGNVFIRFGSPTSTDSSTESLGLVLYYSLKMLVHLAMLASGFAFLQMMVALDANSKRASVAKTRSLSESKSKKRSKSAGSIDEKRRTSKAKPFKSQSSKESVESKGPYNSANSLLETNVTPTVPSAAAAANTSSDSFRAINQSTESKEISEQDLVTKEHSSAVQVLYTTPSDTTHSPSTQPVIPKTLSLSPRPHRASRARLSRIEPVRKIHE
ncbi:UNVERIFIED_CONTAM: hypothetical protein HDU68_007833, partial [Siphonaria sp. JEL0065]